MTIWECLEGLESLRDPPSLDPSSKGAVLGGPMSSTSTTSKKVRPSKATCSLSYLSVSRLWIFEKVENAKSVPVSRRPTANYMYLYNYIHILYSIHIHVYSYFTFTSYVYV